MDARHRQPPHRDQAEVHGCVSQCWRAKAGKSDPIACGPRCVSLHSPQPSPPPPSLFRPSVLVLSNCRVGIPSLSSSLFLSLALPRTPSPTLTFSTGCSCHDAPAHRSLSIATNSSASLLRSPPRPGSSSPSHHHPSVAYCHIRLSVNQHSLRVIYNTHTHNAHPPNITWTQYSHPRTRIQAASGQVSASSRNQTSPAFPLPRRLHHYVRVHSRTPIQWISKTRPVPRARPAVACTLPTVAARPK
jgi:hypothetical protein